MPTAPLSLAKTLTLIEEYSQSIRSLPQLGLRPFVLKPSSPVAIAKLERALGLKLPADVRAFLRRGLKSVEGALEAPFATVGFDFLPAKKILEHTQMLRNVAKNDDDEQSRVIRQGVALTYSEPEIVLSGDAVYHFSFRNSVLVVARTFSEFMEHYLAAGCFSSHDFRAVWKVVKAYRKQFPSYWSS